MKKTKAFYKYTIVAILMVALFGGCKKDFLEITPKGKLVAKTVNDYQLLTNSLDLLNIGTQAEFAMGDDAAALNTYYVGANLKTKRLFSWEAVIYEPNEDATELEVPLKNLYTYNKIINEVMDATEGTEAQKKEVRAQALVGRAWTNFMLINYYGLPYNEQTSATDLGFPLITKADVTETSYTRGTVKQMYDLIVNDLVTAIPDLPPTIQRLRISKAAGEGLLGKVYVFMRKFDLALPQLNASIADMGTATIPVRLYDYNVEFGSTGIFQPIDPNFGPRFPTTINNVENVFSKQTFNLFNFDYLILVSPETMSLFASNDLRLNFFLNKDDGGTPFPAGLRTDQSRSTQYGVVVPDVHLLRAECLARLADIPGAQNAIENFRRNRMPSSFAVPPARLASQNELVKFILEERQREFAGLGYRWFDMRRLSVDPDYKFTVRYTHNIYNAAGAIMQTFTLKAERLVLRIPQKIIDQNPGMPNNP